MLCNDLVSSAQVPVEGPVGIFVVKLFKGVRQCGNEPTQGREQSRLVKPERCQGSSGEIAEQPDKVLLPCGGADPADLIPVRILDDTRYS